MKTAKSDRLQRAVRAVLHSGPQTTPALVASLAELAIRTDSSTLFLECKEFGVATYDEVADVWSAPGTVRLEKAARPERLEADRLRQQRKVPSVAAADSEELRRLRDSVIDPAPAEAVTVFPVDPDWPATARAAYAALQDEHSEVTRRRSQADVPLIAGELVEKSAHRVIVRYEIQSGDSIREGSNASLLPSEIGSGTGDITVEVLTQFGSEITLQLPADSTFPTTARLRCDLTWLVSRQRDTFASLLAENRPGFCSTAALATVSSVGLRETLPLPPTSPVSGLNDQQCLAVAHGMQPRLTWLWGPPGTGKTTTLAALLAELLDAGKTVLLTAPTNAAVDVALNALIRRRPAFTTGDIARVGVTEDPVLLGRPTPVTVDEIAAAQGAAPAQRLVEVRGELADLNKRAEVATKTKSPDRLALTRKIADLTEFKNELDKLVGEVRDQVIRKARLVACTTHQTILKDLYAKNFDTVIIDEASMVSAALAMLVAGAGTGHTVITGDFRQLSPIVQCTTAGAKEWLGKSPFEKSGVADAVRTGRLPGNLVALQQQHRMRRQIGDAIGTAFYPEINLRTAPSVHARPARTVASSQPQLVIVDTAGLAAPVARRGGATSRYNLAHAQLAANILHVPLTTAQVPAAVGLISPFAPQARLLQALTATDDPVGLASTVHRFQGGETDIVLYDVVDTTAMNLKPHSWFTETFTGSEGARLLNVAMSRAREQAILLADMAYLRTSCPAGTPVRRFFTHMADFALVQDWRVAAEFEGPTAVQGTLAPVLADIAAATESIDIFTAATDGALTGDIVKLVQSLPDSVTVSIWYRADDPTSGPRVETPLRHHHTMLHPLRPVRESCIIADSTVWSATGPILGSNPGTLLRTVHPAFADALRRLQLRRSVRDAPGTGQHGVLCACGRLRVREEINGGPRSGVLSVCITCGD
ncbi:DEAD/DEAH box helicase [Nocardia sp. NPDC058640]|uniref:DEAD/DEAH box helicase n=1 Tax=Nocardia sp. NPDC058640 TaxID=3346571 RepID=UPI00365CB64B